ACDYRLAGTHPKVALGLPEVKLGLIPGWGGTQRLPRIVGVPAAFQVVTSGEALNAERSAELGLVAEVVPSERLDEFGRAFLLERAATRAWTKERLRRQSPCHAAHEAELPTTPSDNPAAAAAAAVIRAGCGRPPTEAFSVEAEEFVRLVGSTQAREKIAA